MVIYLIPKMKLVFEKKKTPQATTFLPSPVIAQGDNLLFKLNGNTA